MNKILSALKFLICKCFGRLSITLYLGTFCISRLLRETVNFIRRLREILKGWICLAPSWWWYFPSPLDVELQFSSSCIPGAVEHPVLGWPAAAAWCSHQEKTREPLPVQKLCRSLGWNLHCAQGRNVICIDLGSWDFCCGLLLSGAMFILEAGSVTGPDNCLSGHTNVQCKIS